MANEHTGDDSVTSTPPDRASSGDVTTTGVSSHETADAHGSAAVDAVSDYDPGHGAHGGDAGHGGGHGGHGGHGDDTAEVSTLAETNWRQLLLPIAIIIVVLILLWGPVTGAFQPRPSGGQNTQQTPVPGGNKGGIVAANNTTAPTHAVVAPPTWTTAPKPPTSTSAPPTAQAAAPTTVTVAASTGATNLAPTQTAVAVAGENGDVARVPVELDFSGTTFVIKPGDNLLPDWKPETESGIATWIQGTVANHILYVPYSDQNAALFHNTKAGDKIRLTMNTGQVFEFQVNRSERAYNGPPEQEGQFTVTAAMAQDHAGVTLFLIGDPAPDRAVVQADFTGTIQ